MQRWQGVLCLAIVLGLLPLPVHAQAAAPAGDACVRTITVDSGDTLTELADQYLGDPLAYTRIIAATNASAAGDDTFPTIEDEATIKIGWKLCIPSARETAAAAGAAAVPTAEPEIVSEGGQAEPATAVDGSLAAGELVFDADRLTIDYLRGQSYPGSAITIEQELEPGANYDRYLTSYRSEGLKIYALLTVPQGEAPATGWPAIIFNHGYIPPEVYRTTERYVAYVDALAASGYVVFRPDYRGHGFSEGVALGAYGTPDYTIDVLNALAAVKAYPGVDINRIGMWGHSMGGYITLRAMVTDKSIKAGVIWAGVVASYQDLVERWTQPANDVPTSSRRWRGQLLERYGAPEENPAFWNSISANSYLEDLSGPIQLHHGMSDKTVPIEFSVKLFDQIKAAGEEAEIYTYLGNDHNISQSFEQAMQRTIAFFDEHVKNIQPAPALAGSPVFAGSSSSAGWK